jgi:hypothetical protein
MLNKRGIIREISKGSSQKKKKRYGRAIQIKLGLIGQS